MKAWTAKKIQRLRADAGMTQAQLADWLGVVTMHVSHLEQGIRPPGPQTVRLLDILGERVKAGEVKAAPTQNRKAQR